MQNDVETWIDFNSDIRHDQTSVSSNSFLTLPQPEFLIQDTRLGAHQIECRKRVKTIYPNVTTRGPDGLLRSSPSLKFRVPESLGRQRSFTLLMPKLQQTLIPLIFTRPPPPSATILARTVLLDEGGTFGLPHLTKTGSEAHILCHDIKLMENSLRQLKPVILLKDA